MMQRSGGEDVGRGLGVLWMGEGWMLMKLACVVVGGKVRAVKLRPASSSSTQATANAQPSEVSKSRPAQARWPQIRQRFALIHVSTGRWTSYDNNMPVHVRSPSNTRDSPMFAPDR